MHQTQGKLSVLAALTGNTFVTVLKIIAAIVTGSASLFAESIHSLADTLNQALLLVGLVRSKRSADEHRGYGYGIERFFWSLISACGILFIGAGITIAHSVEVLIRHEPSAEIVFHPMSLIVLVIAFIIEGFTLLVALRELKSGQKLSKHSFANADPVTLAVVYEDGTAVLGVIIAMVAQIAVYFTHNVVYDAIGGLLVGIILGILAVILIIKNYTYIIGKPLDGDTREEIIELLSQDPFVEKVLDFKSQAVDVGKYKIFITVEWNGTPLYREIYDEGELKEEFNEIKDDFEEFTKLMLSTVDRVPRIMGNQIDIIEKKIIEAFPEITYIDIEIN